MIRFLIALFFTTLSAFISHAQKRVLPGANPDPSVVKIGDTYWASATSSNWFPAFPLFYSKDLLNWKQKGYIFNKRPAWADYYFWAPEITYDSGKVYVYYTAHKKNGNLCVGVATADRPEGPYKDLGPLVCQQAGSIDAFPARDTSGKLFLIWKEDANSLNRPTPIWAQEMNETRTALLGDRIELFRNDAPWEKSLVEGVSLLRRGDYYYAFYAAAGCCGSRCDYVTGVARAKNITGPWEKYNRNPILVDTGNWICKGHGTPIERNGRFFFFYHGYDRVTSAFTGREALLQEFRFTPDDWIEFINPAHGGVQRNEVMVDDFEETKLNESFQWSVFDNPKYVLNDGTLQLFASPSTSGSFIGQRIASADYTATATMIPGRSNALAGLAAIGDDKNVLAVLLKENQIQILKVQDGNDTLRGITRIPPREKVYLQMRVTAPYYVSFYYSLNGTNFIALTDSAIRGIFLPPWDSPPRAGLISKGSPQEKAVFDQFEIRAGISNSADITTENRLQNAFELFLYVFAATCLASGVFFFFRKWDRYKAKKSGDDIRIEEEQAPEVEGNRQKAEG